ncbi:HDOD domain-containing protein [Undibacterium parvum]|uniref:HDOD domain-containing protein n=1 Tax=Undibacterium parvum TaxID=401471 RepID=A0A3S9HN31_9BURK|nr:HDOD domain-containing protein [Undibacterium parvum]AZP13522.1 HDOD domain-containing protein [Undibacterium parvum]
MRNTLRNFFKQFSSSTAPEPKASTPLAAAPPSVSTIQPALNPEINAPIVPTAIPTAIPTTAPMLGDAKQELTVAGSPEPSVFSPWKPQLPIDSLFFDWIMAYPGEGCNLEIEQKVLQALFGLLSSDLNDAIVVPRVPTIIPQLLASLRSRSISNGEISRQIVKDVVLVGEVINAVNSALYNPADRINNLENAVMMLGEDGLRLLIAKVAFRPIINLNSGLYTRRAAPHIWAQSEKCAIACRELAIVLDPFEAFLTGMIKNVGLIIAFRLLDQVCEQPKFSYSRAFQQTFSSVAATLSYRIAQRWGFPAEVLVALQQQTPGSKPIVWSELGCLLHDADLLAKMRILANQRQIKIIDDTVKSGLSTAQLACFENLNQVTQY